MACTLIGLFHTQVAAQKNRTDGSNFQVMVAKTKARLKQKEKATFEEFAFLGLSYCFDRLLPYSGSMGNVHANGFNSGSEIFPRLISVENLEKEFDGFHSKHFRRRDFYSYFDMIRQCQSVYHVRNKALKQKYKEIINNPKYIPDWNFDY